MSSWIAVSRTDHANKHWRPRKGFEFAAVHQVVPVIHAELAKVIPHYATGFVQADDGRFQFVALVGVGGERNLYITRDSQWLCDYVPASLRAYPFAVLNDSEGNKVFCLNEDYLSADEAFPRLFQDDGTLEKTAADTLDFITQCEQNRILTVDACAALADAELLEPWSISIGRGEGQEPLIINGMHRINEKKLNTLESETLKRLHDAGALPLAYAQIFSMAQLEQLTQRADYLAKENAKPASASGLENLFIIDEADTLSFDAFESRRSEDN